MAVQQLVAILVLSQEKVSVCPLTSPVFLSLRRAHLLLDWKGFYKAWVNVFMCFSGAWLFIAIVNWQKILPWRTYAFYIEFWASKVKVGELMLKYCPRYAQEFPLPVCKRCGVQNLQLVYSVSLHPPLLGDRLPNSLCRSQVATWCCCCEGHDLNCYCLLFKNTNWVMVPLQMWLNLLFYCLLRNCK